jgi:O-antigen/teichoic acid export membrane protein
MAATTTSPEVTTPSAPGLHGPVVRGMAWKAASAVFYQLTRLAVAAILAHLLSPHDYGVAGMVLVFSGLVMLFGDLQLGTALIQRPVLTEQHRSTVFWTSVAVGLACTLAGIAASGLVADFFGEPQVQPLLAALSVGFLITSVAATQTALMMRDMDFRRLELRDMAGVFAAGVVGIGVAVRGGGAWAIIAQQLTLAVVSTTLIWLTSSWRPSFMFSWASLRDLGGYGANVFGARLLFFVNRNADRILIGRFTGAAALGAYTVAYNLMLTPLSQISLPLQQVLFPAFSRMADAQRIAAAWLRANRLVGALTIPGMLGLIVVAPEFVALVLGDKWSSAIPILQILAWVGLLQSLQGLNSGVLQAMDRTGTLLRYSGVVVVASLIAVVAGLPFGILGVSIAYAISSTVVEPYYTWLTARAVHISLWTVVKTFRGIGPAALAMMGAVAGLRELLIGWEAPVGLRLPLLILAGAAIYLPLLAWRAPEVIADVRELRRRGLRG